MPAKHGEAVLVPPVGCSSPPFTVHALMAIADTSGMARMPGLYVDAGGSCLFVFRYASTASAWNEGRGR